MGFEGLSYESAGEVENTIQDQIQEGKIEIKHLTQERLKTLKVDIRDTNSHLNIRDIKGNDIGDLFEDGKELTYLGDYKRDDNGKIFLHIQNSSGLKGYASAEYLKGKVNLGKININNESGDNAIESQELLSEKAKLKELYLQITDELKKNNIIEKIQQISNLEECNHLLDEIKIILNNQRSPELSSNINEINAEKIKLKSLCNQITNSEKKSEILEKIKECANIEACNTLLEEINTIISNQNNIETNELIYETTLINRDGIIFLVGPNGTEIEYTQELSEANEILLENFETASILNEVISIWKNQAAKVSNSLHWKDSRDDDEIILGEVSKIEEKFSAAYIKAITGKNISQEIDEIFNMIQVAENKEDIIGSSDMEEVKKLLLSDKSKDEKILSIFNTMRYGGWSGDSSNIKEKVSQKLLNTPEFENINNIIKNKQTLELIKNNDTAELINLLGEDLTEEILESYSTIKRKQDTKEMRDLYSKHLIEVNEENRQTGKPEISLNEYIEFNVDVSVMNLLKHSLIRAKIDKISVRGGETESYTGLYADISGLAERRASMNDIFDIGDDNIDTAIDISATLSLSLVSMGVGMLAARAAMWAARSAVNISGASNLANKAGKIGGLSRFAGASTIEGSAFYAGTTGMNTLIYGNDLDTYTDGEINKKELVKSIAFMGVLRGVGSVMKAAGNAQMTQILAKSLHQKDTITITEKILASIGNLSTKVPPLMLRGTSVTGVLTEAGLVTATSVGLEVAFEGEGHFTWEEYLQAVVMVGLFRGATKISISKNSKGEVQVKELKPETKDVKSKVKEQSHKTETKVEQNITEVIYIHKATGKEYVFIAEGKNGKIKVKNENGKVLQVSKKNVEIKSEQYVKEVINDKDFNAFVKDKKVSDEILNNIAQKLSKNEKLSPREEQIRQIKSDKINKILELKINKSTDKTDTKEKTTEKQQKTEKIAETGNKEIDVKLTGTETSRFKDLFNKIFDSQKTGSHTFVNKKGDQININKLQNGKFTKGENLQTYSKGEIMKEIHSSYKLETLEQHVFQKIMNLSKGQEFSADKTWGIPGTAKVKFMENGFIEVKTKGKNGENINKILKGEKEIKEFLSNTKVRESILKQKLEKMTATQVLDNMKTVKGFKEKLGKLSDGALLLFAERWKAMLTSGLIGGTTFLVPTLLGGGSDLEGAENKFLDLAYIFAIGAVGGVAISGLKTGGIIILKSGKNGFIAVKEMTVAAFNATLKTRTKKIVTGSVVVGGITGYNILSDND